MCNNKSVYTIVTVLGKTFTLFTDFFKQWKIFLIYAAVLTVLSAVFGNWSYSCITENNDFWCYPSSQNIYIRSVFYIVYYVLILIIYFLFMGDLCGVKKGEYLKWQDSFHLNKSKLIKCGFLFLYLLSITLPLAIGMIIMQKPAVPDWRIEFIFFLITFTMFVIPLYMIRFSAVVGCFLRDGKMPLLKFIYKVTKGKSYIPLLTMLGLLFLITVLNIKVIATLSFYSTIYNNFGMAVLSEFLQHIIILAYFAIITAFCLGQAEILDIQQEIDNNLVDNKKKERNKK